MALPSLLQYLLFGVVFGLATVRKAHPCYKKEKKKKNRPRMEMGKEKSKKDLYDKKSRLGL